MAVRVFSYDAGRVCLDLLATLGDRREERLLDPAALKVWLVGAGLVDEACAVDADDLARTASLRRALFSVVDAHLLGERPDFRHLEEINAAAALPAHSARLVPGPSGLELERDAATVVQALGAIARDAIDLLGGPERALLRECEAADCSGVYVDRSRGGRRRWCSTARCGNRARVAAHRARHAASRDG